ncbi:MAG: RnfH family protein [Rudaea sp.]
MPERIRISVAYADLHTQIERQAEVAVGATIEEAIRASGIRNDLPDSFTPASIAIFGRKVGAETRLHDGDRIELCRPLQIDPKQARRQRAKVQP